MAIQDVLILNSANIICSRLKRDEMLMVPALAPLSGKAICCTLSAARDLNNARLHWSGSGYLALYPRHRHARGRVAVTNEARSGQENTLTLQVKNVTTWLSLVSIAPVLTGRQPWKPATAVHGYS
ncbi:hypothetical protein KIF59_10600 [Enterobacter cloacae subsp. cloacae]|nr:hypothetical protein [Enterobacter cloacae subsp. cloacae]